MKKTRKYFIMFSIIGIISGYFLGHVVGGRYYDYKIENNREEYVNKAVQSNVKDSVSEEEKNLVSALYIENSVGGPTEAVLISDQYEKDVSTTSIIGAIAGFGIVLALYKHNKSY